MTNYKITQGCIEMKIKKIDILILLLLFIISMSFYLNYSTPVIWSPDEMNYFLASEKFLENGNVNVNNPLNEEYSTCVFNYGFTVFKNRSEQYPGGFSGSVLFYSIITLIFGDSAFFLVSPLFGAIGVVAIYFITREIFNSRYLGIFAALILFTTPIWIRWSTEHYNNLPTATFFLLSFLSLVTLKKDLRYLISGVFLSIAIFLRLPSLILTLPFLLFLYIESTKKRQYLLFLSPIIFTLLIILPLLKLIMYGDPFFIPFNYIHNYPCFKLQSYAPIQLYHHFWFASAERNAILYNSYFFFTKNFASLFLPFSLLGLILLFKERKNVSIFIFLVLLILLLFHGRGYGGYGAGGRETLQSSFLRYILPAYGLLPIGFACLVKKIFKKIPGKKYISALLAIFIITTLSFTITYPDYGLDMFEEYRNTHIAIGNKIDSMIEPESIIITDLVCLVPSVLHHENIIYYPKIPQEIRHDEIERVLKMALEYNKKIHFVGAMYEGSEIEKEDRAMLNLLGEEFKITKLDGVYYIEVYIIDER